MQHAESRNGEKRAQILIMPALKKWHLPEIYDKIFYEMNLQIHV